MAYLRNTKNSIRVYESYEIKESLKKNGYIFDERGFWYKVMLEDKDIKEYEFLDNLGVNLLLPDDISLEDIKFIELNASEVALMAAQNPKDGIALMKKWSIINSWANGPKNIPAKGMIF